MKMNWAVAILVLGLTGCQAPERPRFGRNHRPIFGGSPDTVHGAVVAIEDRTGFCTGTLITRTVILTAAHCITASDPSSYDVYFGDNMNGATVPVSEVLAHPAFSDWTGDNDIGLMRLSSDAPAGVTAIPYLPGSLALAQADLGADLDFSGFGDTETGSWGDKLHVIVPLSYLCGPTGSCSYKQESIPNNFFCYAQASGGTCVGDSGGPAFISRGGAEYVAGITSFGDDDCTSYGCSTTVDAYEDFILTFIGQAADGTSCQGGAACNSGLCFDGVCCATACDTPCASCNQNGSAGLCLPTPDGSSCSDNDACNGAETCAGGTCQVGNPLSCDDADPCTTDSCAPATGCFHDPSPADPACQSAEDGGGGGCSASGAPVTTGFWVILLGGILGLRLRNIGRP